MNSKLVQSEMFYCQCYAIKIILFVITIERGNECEVFHMFQHEWFDVDPIFWYFHSNSIENYFACMQNGNSLRAHFILLQFDGISRTKPNMLSEMWLFS